MNTRVNQWNEKETIDDFLELSLNVLPSNSIFRFMCSRWETLRISFFLCGICVRHVGKDRWHVLSTRCVEFNSIQKNVFVRESCGLIVDWIIDIIKIEDAIAGSCETAWEKETSTNCVQRENFVTYLESSMTPRTIFSLFLNDNWFHRFNGGRQIAQFFLLSC